MAAQAPLGLGGLLFFGGLSAGTFGLGCWQTQRLFHKQVALESREQELAMEPTTDVSSTSFRRLLVQGQFRHDDTILVGPRGPPAGALLDQPGSSGQGMSSAPQGYYVLTPLDLNKSVHNKNNNNDNQQQQHSSVLVNRGWVPRDRVMAGSQRGRPAAQVDSSLLFQWDRPTGNVQLLAVPGKPEGTNASIRFCAMLVLEASSWSMQSNTGNVLAFICSCCLTQVLFFASQSHTLRQQYQSILLPITI
jgi:hypothetical protein